MASSNLAGELDELTDVDLETKLRESKEELFNLRFQAATGQLESHGRLRRSRRTSPGSTPWCASASSASGPRRVPLRRRHEREHHRGPGETTAEDPAETPHAPARSVRAWS